MRTLLTMVAAALVAGVVPAQATTYRDYVALGDSYAAIASLHTVYGTPGCFRSRDNYAGNLARALGVAAFDDRSCGSATTEHMTNPQPTPLAGTNEPQFAGLSPETDLVTITIGGNDLGFSDIVSTCGLLSVTDPFGNPCERHFGTQLHDRIARLAPTVGAILDGVRDRAPQARIIVVGYLSVLPPHTGCAPAIPLATRDVSYLYGVIRGLSGMLAEQASTHGAIAVDPSGITGHDGCQLPWRRWVEPTVPAAPTTPFHPNAAGQRALAELVVNALG